MLVAALLALASVAQTADAAGEAWVRETAGRLSLREKVGQLFMGFRYSRFANREAPDLVRIRREIGELGIGGMCLSLGTAPECALLASELQSWAKVPLLLAADFEAGAGFRMEGATRFPSNMAFGAAGSEAFAREAGRVTAAEGRALGIHLAFAPVLDVQRNPDNPIVNHRSYGEDPALVARLGAAFIRGCRDGGLLCTAKHFPGHGATSVDSHISLPTVADSRETLERTDLAPFGAAVEAGVAAFMTGHLDVPALTEESGLPASLSPRVLEVLLRKRMGFEGLVVTDALEMGGVAKGFAAGEAAVRALLAGSDVLLMSPDPGAAIDAIVAAVEAGRIPPDRIDRSVERILRAKAAVGLHAGSRDDPRRVFTEVGRPEFRALADRVADASITALRNASNALPLAASRVSRVRLVCVRDGRDDEAGRVFERELRRRAKDLRVEDLSPDDPPARIEEAARRLDPDETVIFALHLRARAWKGSVGLPPALAPLADALASRAIVVLFGNPYPAARFANARAVLCAYSSDESSERAAARALFGEIAVGGTCPVTIPGVARRGDRLEIPMRAADPRKAQAPAASPAGVEGVFAAVERGVAGGAFPGAVCVAGIGESLWGPRAFGKLSDDAGPAAPDTVYDLASLTKVVATTTAAMLLHEEGKFPLDRAVRELIPAFSGGDRDRVTLRHLLAHASGLAPFGPLWKNHAGKEAYLAAICGMPLEAAPGAKAIYSDYGAILLGASVEAAAGEPLDRFCVRRIFEPLGMRSTAFRPPADWAPRIAPTEVDARRGGALRGRVHDENADAMGGVAGHAGLFSTAGDLAAFCRSLLGIAGPRLAKPETVARFAARAELPPGSTRALGWDTPSEKHFAAPLGTRSFGHTGFTGTSIWCVPEKRAFVLLLSNRVHPTRENRRIDGVRREVHAAFARLLAEG